MNVLLVSPQIPDTFWSFKHALRFISKKAASPPLGLLTIAASLPEQWHLKLVDLNITRLNDTDIRWADYVMVSAMIVHREFVHEIAARCAALDRPLIGGGPIFTTGHEAFPDIPHFVLGEAEDLMADLVRDMERGSVRHTYEARERPDLTGTPIPRWDLIRLEDYASMPVQFSRGCPYDCEFCDIVVMNGHRPRTKTPQQMTAELDALRVRGWQGSVFIVDDNFIGNKRKVKELLAEILSWRARTGARMDFLTEASVNLADDRELLELMSDVGFKKVFLGIETPVLESLRECHKLQNTRLDLTEAVRRIQNAGMEVMGGFIVGFDNDRADIFERQFEFIQNAGVVTAMVGLLNALPETKLYKRLLAEGRLLSTTTGNNTEATTNIETLLDRDFLIAGYRRLMQSLYEPRAYYRRLKIFLKNYESRGPAHYLSATEVRALFKSFWLLGVRSRGRRAYWTFLAYTLLRHPRKFSEAITLAITGHHFRTVAATL